MDDFISQNFTLHINNKVSLITLRTNDSDLKSHKCSLYRGEKFKIKMSPRPDI